MSAKRIFILNGHPAESSLTRALSAKYEAAAREAGAEVRVLHMHDLSFDPDFGYAGYSNHKPLEPDLEAVMEDILWSEHFVLFTPMWWGGLPAKLKGLFDRAFLPGTTFDTRNKSALGVPKPMLGGRTARVVILSDTPMAFVRLVYHRAMIRQVTQHILAFVGIKPSKVTWLSGATDATPEKINGWKSDISDLGQNLA